MTNLYDQDDSPDQDDLLDDELDGRFDANGAGYDADGYDADAGYDAEDSDEYVTIPGGTGGRRKWLVVLLGVFIVMALLLGGAALAIQRKIDPPGDPYPGAPGDPAQPGDPETQVELEIPEGSTSDAIGRLLADHGVITSETVWEWYLRVKGGGPFLAGFYVFQQDSSMGEAIQVLERGPAPPDFAQVTVPEAFMVTEIVGRLADPEKGIERFSSERLGELLFTGVITSRSAGPTGSMEGLLFPDTYRIEEEEDEQAVLQRMADRLDEILDELGADTVGAELGLTRNEIVVIASLIEEEARVPEDQAKIARVIYNRLAQGIPLGIDATSRYEAILEGRDRDALDFDSTSPYNTRKIAGLPPTPIAAPGRGAIAAALAPADGPWIFYVLQDEAGHHFFTESADEFARAKAECRDKGLGCG